MASPNWITEWGILTKEWIVGAFCAATLDWIASKVPLRPGLIATLFSTAQLATTVTVTNMASGLLGDKSASQFLTENWFLFNVIWQMSPTAVHRLTGGYTKFHRILYGTTPLPSQVIGGCVDGNCNTDKGKIL